MWYSPAPDSPTFLGTYPTAEGSDYEEQIRGINRIRNIVINATRRIIFYDLPIYDDMRLEMSEYVGLTLAVRDSSVRTLVRQLYDQVAIRILDDDSELLRMQHNTYYVYPNARYMYTCSESFILP